jgi:ribosomal protein L7Ae-like RNA K-turn-binding protein
MVDFYEIIEKAKKTGKIDKGTNEVRFFSMLLM